MSGHSFSDGGSGSATHVTRPIRVLLVDDDPAFTEVVAIHLERANDAFEIVREHDVAAALATLREGSVDCIVSDYEMPERSGLAFLGDVREAYPRVPFVLYTGRGSETVASEAISAGVDDYLQKGNVAEQAPLLARRIVTLVRNHRMTDQLRENERRYRTLVEMSPHPIVVHVDATVVYANDALVDLVGATDRESVVGTPVTDFLHPEERDAAREVAERTQLGEAAPTQGEWRVVTQDDEVRFVETTSRPITYEEEAAVLTMATDTTRRKQYERALTSLHERTREMMRADDAETTASTAVETTDELLSFDASAFYAFEQGADELAPSAPATGVPDPVDGLTEDATRSPLWDAFVDGESAVYERLTERDEVTTGDGLRRLVVVPVGNHGVFVAGGAEAATVTETQHNLVRLVAKNLEAALDRADDRRAIEDRDRQLRRQNESLAKLNRINEVIRDVNQAVVRAATREEIERTVCEQFAETGVYEFAWIGEPVAAEDDVAPRAWAGVDAEYVDSLNERASPLRALLTDATESRTVRVARRLLDDLDWATHRREVLTYGYRAVAAVPVLRSDHLDGVLVVYASDGDAFEERERAVLAELGRTVGYAIRNAVRSSGVPTSERTEVELAVDDPKFFANRLSALTGGDVTLEGAPSRSGDRLTAFVRLAGAAPDAASVAVADCGPVESMRELGAEEGTGVYLTTLTVSPLVDILRDAEATLRSLSASEGTTTVVVDLPAEGDVRSLVEAVRGQYPGTSLLARRERDAPVESRWTFREKLRGRLTDRQLEVLRTAYHGGYYDSPRESTGHELATALGISPPTYHHHLRTAERKIVSAVLTST